jgi:predicted transcriptional regulator
MKRRTRLAVVAGILMLCQQPQNKTKIMYTANLSWKAAGKYLSDLQARGLLQIHHSPIKYVSAERGRQFIERWKHLRALL